MTLGYYCFTIVTPATVATHRASFGAGMGLIHLDNVVCNGEEPQLANCTHSGIGVHNCNHSEDAGVICQGNIMSFTAYRDNKISC